MEGRLMRHQPAFLIYSLYDTGSKLLNNVSHVCSSLPTPAPLSQPHLNANNTKAITYFNQNC